MCAARSDQLRHAIARLHAAKTADYGHAWKKRGEVLSVLANEARKVDRIEEVAARETSTNDESLFDTYVDLLVYLLKHQTLLADEDREVAKALGLVGQCERPYSEKLEAFNVLLERVDLSFIDDNPTTHFRPARITAAFSALEANFEGLTAAAATPVSMRLEAVQYLVSETVAGLAALTTSSSSQFDAFLAGYGASSRMENGDYTKFVDETRNAILAGAANVGILGVTSICTRLIADIEQSGLIAAIRTIYSSEGPNPRVVKEISVLRFDRLRGSDHDLLVVASDANKEDLLQAALPHLSNAPRVVLYGYGHFAFRDSTFTSILNGLLVPSLANGYPNTQTHLYQCLCNAARLRLSGVVAEFGMFKGGTTMFLSRVIEHLGQNWRVIGFDTFGGFPARRSVLDMYAHPDCVFTDLSHVRAYLADRDVEIVVGDVVETRGRLADEDLVLTFMDTDNYSSAAAALDIVQERTVVGGAIVFDHFTGTNRFLYTLGERMAAARLLEDSRYLNLHGTGVFYRQR
jgi:hypothetical protein